MSQISVFINPMKVLDWEDLNPTDPTPERLLNFVCTLGARNDMAALKKRYNAISEHDQEMNFFPQDAAVAQNVWVPLRQAKIDYLLANYVGVIASCGIVAEKVAILIHALHSSDEVARDAFEKLGQEARVKELKEANRLTPQMVQDFGQIRGTRRTYLHYWTDFKDERMAKEALQAYRAAVGLVLALMDVEFVDGALKLSAPMTAYLKGRGVIRDSE